MIDESLGRTILAEVMGLGRGLAELRGKVENGLSAKVEAIYRKQEEHRVSCPFLRWIEQRPEMASAVKDAHEEKEAKRRARFGVAKDVTILVLAALTFYYSRMGG